MQTVNENKKIGRKERERLFKRREILLAAVDLFARNGFENTKLDDIAEASEFGKGTLYNYFHNKEEIYFASIKQIFDDYCEMHERILNNTETLKEYFEETTKSLIQYCVNNKSSFIMLVRFRTRIMDRQKLEGFNLLTGFYEQVNQMLTKRIKQAIKNNEIRKVDSESLILLYKSMIIPYLHLNFIANDNLEIDVEKETKFILSVLFNGILIK
ncbi:MAG: TetR/AcrR family transcriptional regulator [Ignavibacteriae bacterium]|nr:TetR/AcrR family transcriptional regulator [Ignavibacteriota bacterium]